MKPEKYGLATFESRHIKDTQTGACEPRADSQLVTSIADPVRQCTGQLLSDHSQSLSHEKPLRVEMESSHATPFPLVFVSVNGVTRTL